LNKLLPENIGLKFLLIFITAVSFDISSQEAEGNNRINIISNQQPLRSVLDQVRSQADINIIYDDNLIDDLKISCKIESEIAGNAIKNILKDLNIDYKKFNADTFVLIRKNKPVKESYTTILEQQPMNRYDENVILTEPKQISEIPAVYPPEAEKYNIEGKVGIKLLINDKGNVTKHIIYKSSGFNVLDSAAIGYATGLKFTPALANDEPISIWLSFLVNYKILKKH